MSVNEVNKVNKAKNTRTIMTRDFSKVEIDENMVLSFPKGIFAFEDEKEFVLLSPLGKDTFPMWLQSTAKENLCFIVFDPKELCEDYSITVAKDDLDTIDYSEGHSVEYLALAVIPQDYKDTTVNLKSPLVVDNSTKKAVQTIAQESFPLKFSVYKKEEN